MLIILLYVFAGAILLYALLLWLWPKGNLLHEVLHIFPYWLQVFRLPKKDIHTEAFSFGKHKDQYLLFCTPPDGKIPEGPIIIYYHGGGWRHGSPKQFKMIAQVLTRRGFAVVLPSYRRTPWYNYDHIREDLNLSLSCIQEVLAQKGITSPKFIIGGMSAGGNLAAHIVFNRKALQQLGLSQAQFIGLFLLAPPLQLELMPSSEIVWSFAGSRKSTRFQRANPYNYLEAPETIPTICIQGTKDGMVPYRSTRVFMEKLAHVHQGNFEFHVLEGKTHLGVGKWVVPGSEPHIRLFSWLESLVPTNLT